MRLRVGPLREGVFSSPLHDERTAAVLGLALGVAFGLCFVTGVISHLVQQPPAWFTWPSALPARVRAPVEVGLIVSGVVVLFAWPFLRGYGLRPDNPSALPNDYAAGLAGVLGGVWLVCSALTLWAWLRPRARR